jgi:hygromycin-B 4-O-kinase
MTDLDNPEQINVSTHKTSIDIDVVIALLEGLYPGEISHVEFVAGGEGSQAFSFNKGDEGFIVRINRHSDEGFKKDQRAFLQYGSDIIPIPQILQIGQMQNGYYFAISHKIQGRLAKHVPPTDLEQVVPGMFTVLDAIHAIDIGTTSGYGKWDSAGNAHCATWKDFLLEVNTYTIGTETQPSLFDTSFLEKDVWDVLYALLVELTQHCPEERYLLHGDFGFDNLFVVDGQVAGVIDWEHSMYGDFLYDVAWLAFWSKGFDFKAAYKAHAASKGQDIPNLEERLLCYQLYIGLGSLSFYAYSNQKDKYDSSKARLLGLVGK